MSLTELFGNLRTTVSNPSGAIGAMTKEAFAGHANGVGEVGGAQAP